MSLDAAVSMEQQLQRPGTVSQGKRPALDAALADEGPSTQQASEPANFSLDALMGSAEDVLRTQSRDRQRAQSISLEEALALEAANNSSPPKSFHSTPSPEKYYLSSEVPSNPSSSVRTSTNTNTPTSLAQTSPPSASIPRKLHTSIGTRTIMEKSVEMRMTLQSSAMSPSRRSKTAGNQGKKNSKTSRTRGMNMNMLFESPDVSYRREQKPTTAQLKRNPLQEDKGMSLNFLLPKSVIPERHSVAERWPIVPNLLRARKLSSFKSLNEEGVYYDDASKQWCKTVFPSWQPGSREDTVMLRKWANEAIDNFNGSTPSASVLDDMKNAQKILTTAFSELTRQVLIGCRERGKLMGELWNSQTVLFAKALEISEVELKQTHWKLEEAENRIDDAKTAALDEKINQVLKKRELTDENEAMKKELKDLRKRVERMGLGESSGGSPDSASNVGPRRRSRFTSQKMDMNRAAGLSQRPISEGNESMGGGGGVKANVKTSIKGGRRSSTRAEIVIEQLNEKADLITSLQKREDSLAEENAMLRDMVASIKSEFVGLQKELIRLEQIEAETMDLESRAEYAENRFEDMKDQMRSMTPRPDRDFGGVAADYEEVDGQDLMDILNDALDEPKYRDMPAESLTSMLLGQTDNGVPLQPYMSFRGCLEPLVTSSSGKLSRKKLEDSLRNGNLEALEELCPHEVILLMQRALRDKFEVISFCNFLCGIDACSNIIDPEYFGSIAHMEVPRHELLSMIKNGCMATTTRVDTLIEDKRKMRREIQESKENLNRFMQTEQRKELARKKKEQQQRKMKPLDLLLADIEASDTSKFKSSFIGLGNGSDVPSFLRLHGKIPFKKMSKRETEKMTKEIWKSKLDWEAKTGDQFYLIDFVYIYFKDAVGIQSSIAQEGYNFVFSLKKYSYDVDCELFLKILTGDVMEEVYLEQLDLQRSLEKLMVTLDRVSNKKESGFIEKTELKSALLSFFSVGQPNGKQNTRFEELLDTLNQEQAGPKVDYRKLLSEDEDFNQGPFMESVREQMLMERIEYFKELENLIYEETGYDEKCEEEHVKTALLKIDSDMSKLELRKKLHQCFPKGVEVTTVALAVSTLKRGATKVVSTKKKAKRGSTFRG